MKVTIHEGKPPLLMLAALTTEQCAYCEDLPNKRYLSNWAQRQDGKRFVVMMESETTGWIYRTE